MDRDFTLSSTRFVVSQTSSQEIIITFRVDSIAQEPVEEATLVISPSDVVRGVIIQDRLELVITDNDSRLYSSLLRLYESIIYMCEGN